MQLLKGHKCTPYCDPDDNVHCIPDMWDDNRTIEDWRWVIKRHEMSDRLDVIRAEAEPDVNGSMVPVNYMGDAIVHEPGNIVGYLVWFKIKDGTIYG